LDKVITLEIDYLAKNVSSVQGLGPKKTQNFRQKKKKKKKKKKEKKKDHFSSCSGTNQHHLNVSSLKMRILNRFHDCSIVQIENRMCHGFRLAKRGNIF
jgi:hypothetical protein